MSLTKTFNALADPTRHKILRLLKVKDLAAGLIASRFEISAPSISHHLGVLREAGLVTSRRKGREVIYALNLSAFEEAADAVLGFFKSKK